jgi:hypothetical protein
MGKFAKVIAKTTGSMESIYRVAKTMVPLVSPQIGLVVRRYSNILETKIIGSKVKIINTNKII